MIYQNATAEPREELTDVIMEGVTDRTDFIGLQVLGEVPLTLQNGHVPKITIADGDPLRSTTKIRKPGSAFDRWQSTIDDHSIALLQVAEEVQLPDEQMLTYEDYFPIEAVYAAEAGNRLLRGLELDISGAVFNASNFTNGVNSATAYTAANLATMTPVADITAAIRRVKALGERPDTLVMSGPVYDRIRQSADMRSWIAGSVNPGARVSEDTIQQSFSSMGIKKVLVGDTYVNQSQSTKNNSINQIWSNTYIFVGACKSGKLQAGGVGRTFYWEKLGPLLNASSYRDEKVMSNVIRALKTSLSDITNARAGTLIVTQYS